MILGLSWLHKHNPEVNWETGQVMMSRCPLSCWQPSSLSTPPTLHDKTPEAVNKGDLMLELGDGIFAAYLPSKDEVAHLRGMLTHSQRLAQEAADPAPLKQSFEELVPEPY
jgi:hypothetical protein